MNAMSQRDLQSSPGRDSNGRLRNQGRLSGMMNPRVGGKPAIGLLVEAVLRIVERMRFVNHQSRQRHRCGRAVGVNPRHVQLRQHKAPLRITSGSFRIQRHGGQPDGRELFHGFRDNTGQRNVRIATDGIDRMKLRLAVDGFHHHLSAVAAVRLQVRDRLPVFVVPHPRIFLLPQRRTCVADAVLQLCCCGIIGGIERRADHRPVFVQINITRVIEERCKLIVLFVTKRIVGMAVALHAAERHALPRLPGGVHPVDHGGNAEFLIVRAPLFIGLRDPMSRGGHIVFNSGLRQQIAGDLLDGKLIERQIRIQRGDDPVAKLPDRTTSVCSQAARIGVTHLIQPDTRPAFSEGGRSQQAIDHAGFCGSRIQRKCREKLTSVRQRGRQSCQVERHPPQPAIGRRIGTGHPPRVIQTF